MKKENAWSVKARNRMGEGKNDAILYVFYLLTPPHLIVISNSQMMMNTITETQKSHQT